MKRTLFFAAVISLLNVLFMLGCNKDDNGTNGDDPKIPVLSTYDVTEITQVTALSGGVITDDGGKTITVRGVCWSTNEAPTIAGNKTENGAGAGAFTSQIEGLSSETTYYVRAYATNSAGTGYGMAMSFETPEPALPVLTTDPANNITATTAISGGEIANYIYADVISCGIVWNLSEHPTLENNVGMTIDGLGSGKFISHMTDLLPASIYFVRSYATNSIGVTYGDEQTCRTVSILPPQSCPGTPTITDQDGNIYNTVLIGNQCWMKENLSTTKYRNGEPIEYPGENNIAWYNNTTGAYAWEDNDINWKDSYGALYNWHAVNHANGLCPAGWHVPSDAEWTQLVNYVVAQGFSNNLDNSYGAGNALKSCRRVDSPLGGECNTPEHPRWSPAGSNYGFDEFGFSALPGNERNLGGSFDYWVGIYGSWWSSTGASQTHAWLRHISLNSGWVGRFNDNKRIGASLRCIMD